MTKPSSSSDRRHLFTIRVWLMVFIVGLVISGVTAFPLVHETRWLAAFVTAHHVLPEGMSAWVGRVHLALEEQALRYPFLAYGTDWLAFAHILLAIAYVGPLVDPVRNKWLLHFGLIACAGVPLLALIAGSLRGIPLGWRFIDCSFGVCGAIPLLMALHHTSMLQRRATAIQG